MAKLSLLAGSTSQSVNIFVQNSSVTTGAGLTGLVFNTASLKAYYTFAGANTTATSITLATLAAVTSAYSSGGFKEVDATNMPGVYRLDIPNAALAASKGNSVVIMLFGATNMVPVLLEIELTGWNNQDGVHGGFSCLPNTAVTTNASLITSGTGTDQLQVTSGLASANAKQINAVATTSVTTINANQGTTQPINFTGTGASALCKSDMVDIAGAAVSTSTAQIGTNVVSVAGAASNVKKNQALNAFMFVMVDSSTNAPKTGVTVSATRSLDGGAFGACANAVTEISSGWYSINLATTDMNANVVALRFTGSGASDRDITLVTQI